jgi:hypothetical protein
MLFKAFAFGPFDSLSVLFRGQIFRRYISDSTTHTVCEIIDIKAGPNNPALIVLAVYDL